MRDGELQSVVTRSMALRVISADAALERCRVGVFRSEGEPLSRAAGLEQMTVTVVNGSATIEGAPGPASAAPVRIFQRVVGWAVAVAHPSSGNAAARRVAHRASLVLGDLCSREYELNDLSREILAAYEELNLFYDLASELAQVPDRTAICDAVLGRAMHVIPARAGRIVIREGGITRVESALGDVTHLAGTPGGDEIGPGAAVSVLESRQAQICEGLEQIEEGTSDAWERAAAASLITVPMYVEGRDAIGVLQLRDRSGGDASDVLAQPGSAQPFTAGDAKLAQALASQAALLVENSRLIGFERELQIARHIQDALMPAAPPTVEGLDVAAACVQASNVGGDYYDFVRGDDGALTVVLADVSGHHLAAALMQTAARATFRAAALADRSPRTVLDRVNRVLMDDLARAEQFITAWFARVDGATGDLEYGDAGHHPALVYRAVDGRVEELGGGGLPLGVDEDGLYTEHATRLAPGDVLLTYTDGLSEARGPNGDVDLFGDERVAESLARAAHGSAADIVAALLDDVQRFGRGEGADDRTLVVLKKEPGTVR